ncbi:MAG TPA: hypothetical protein VLJ59_10010 [Mycobacteriales bacterium]|nr:hypothetical protein [Mycobacteriales bacterium]
MVGQHAGGLADPGLGAGTRFAPGAWRFVSLASGQRYRIRLDFIDSAGRLGRRIEAFTAAHPNYTMRLSIRVPLTPPDPPDRSPCGHLCAVW